MTFGILCGASYWVSVYCWISIGSVRLRLPWRNVLLTWTSEDDPAATSTTKTHITCHQIGQNTKLLHISTDILATFQKEYMPVFRSWYLDNWFDHHDMYLRSEAATRASHAATAVQAQDTNAMKSCDHQPICYRHSHSLISSPIKITSDIKIF